MIKNPNPIVDKINDNTFLNFSSTCATRNASDNRLAIQKVRNRMMRFSICLILHMEMEKMACMSIPKSFE